jgi:hypothetical protein
MIPPARRTTAQNQYASAMNAILYLPRTGFPWRYLPRDSVTAPFLADLTDWLSSTAAEGLASRPIRSRNAICGSAEIASYTPSRWNLRKML